VWIQICYYFWIIGGLTIIFKKYLKVSKNKNIFKYFFTYKLINAVKFYEKDAKRYWTGVVGS
jgi:hypothetical protein